MNKAHLIAKNLIDQSTPAIIGLNRTTNPMKVSVLLLALICNGSAVYLRSKTTSKVAMDENDTPLLPPPLVPPSKIMSKLQRSLQMTMSEEDEPGYATTAAIAAPATAVPVETAVLAEPEPVQVAAAGVPVESVVLAEPEPVQVAAPAAVVPVETAVLAEPEPVQVAAPAAVVPVESVVLAEPEPVQVAAPAAVVPVESVVLAEPEPVQVAAPAAVVPVESAVLAETAASVVPMVPATIATPVPQSSPKLSTDLSVPGASPNVLWAAAFSKHTTDEALLALFDVASQLKAVYLSFDINGDGTVSADEVSEVTSPSTVASLRRLNMELAGSEEPEQVVATAELPTPEEAENIHTSPNLTTMFDLVEKLTIAHTYFDADRNGAVSAADLIAIAKGPQ